MDRNALLLYLQNVRDLEVARYWLQVCFQKEKGNYQNQVASLKRTDYQSLSDVDAPSLGCGFVFIFLLALGSLFCVIMTVIPQSAGGGAGRLPIGLTIFAWISFFVWGGLALCMFIVYRENVREYEKTCDNIIRHNREEKERGLQNKNTLNSLTTQWKSRTLWFQQEIEKLNTLLKNFYDMNIIPVQFRNLSAVCYIYDYMSTSQESLTTALFDQRLEDGIRRLEAKLDTVISRIETVIYETRCIRQNSERMIAQNSGMLESLQRTESNTLQAAQYAQLSANYSKANAYFGLATYLKN